MSSPPQATTSSSKAKVAEESQEAPPSPETKVIEGSQEIPASPDTTVVEEPHKTLPSTEDTIPDGVACAPDCDGGEKQKAVSPSGRSTTPVPTDAEAARGTPPSPEAKPAEGSQETPPSTEDKIVEAVASEPSSGDGSDETKKIADSTDGRSATPVPTGDEAKVAKGSSHGTPSSPQAEVVEGIACVPRPEYDGDEKKKKATSSSGRSTSPVPTDDDVAGPEDASPATRLSTHASERTLPPPDGGTRAWLTCICGHIVMANTWGIINSFGVFQAYYADLLHLSPSQISWIGSIQFFLGNFLSIFSGRVSDAGHFRLALALGSSLVTLGLFATSFCTQYWQLLLAQGVTVGTGVGFMCCPMLSITSSYFSKRKSFALGSVSTGIVSGGILYAAMARQLLPTLGFGWAMRIIAFTVLAFFVFVNVVARDRARSKVEGPLIDVSVLRDPGFVLFSIGGMLSQAGNYTGLFYLPQFSRTQLTPNLSYPDSLNLLMIFNGVSFVGRIVPSHFADRLGAVNLSVPAVLGTGVHLLGWIGVSTPAAAYAWTCVYGLVAGSMMGLYPTAVNSLAAGDGVRRAGGRMGVAFAINSFATFVGPPVAGAIITRTGGSYKGAHAYAGGLLLAAFVFTVASKVGRRVSKGEKWLDKV